MAEHCCDLMRHYVEHEGRVIDFLDGFDEYLVPVHDYGSARSGVLMRFCPWCGTKLPDSRRDEVLGPDGALWERWELLPENPVADLDDWIVDLQGQQPASIPKVVRVKGIWHEGTGDPGDRVEVEVVAEPAQHWVVEVDLADEERRRLERQGYLRWAIFGMLDVLVTHPHRPVLDILLRITALRAGPGPSSKHAFRMAGRDAANKILVAALKN